MDRYRDMAKKLYQEPENDVIVGTIDNTESEEKVYEPRQKKKKVTEEGCGCKK